MIHVLVLVMAFGGFSRLGHAQEVLTESPCVAGIHGESDAYYKQKSILESRVHTARIFGLGTMAAWGYCLKTTKSIVACTMGFGVLGAGTAWEMNHESGKIVSLEGAMKLYKIYESAKVGTANDETRDFAVEVGMPYELVLGVAEEVARDMDDGQLCASAGDPGQIFAGVVARFKR